MERTAVGARELKNRLGKYLKRIKLGETVVVTDRGVAYPRVGFAERLDSPDQLRSATVELTRRARSS